MEWGEVLVPCGRWPVLLEQQLMGASMVTWDWGLFHYTQSSALTSLLMQNGRFDAPDRLFWSIADTWKSVLTLPSDVKVSRSRRVGSRWLAASRLCHRASCPAWTVPALHAGFPVLSPAICPVRPLLQELVPEFYSNDPSFLVGAGLTLFGLKRSPCCGIEHIMCV